MNKSISATEYKDFCEFLQQSCGITLGENKQYLIHSRLSRIMEDRDIPNVSSLLTKLASSTNIALRDEIIDAMTTNETFWFRDLYPFEILKNIVYPDMIKQNVKNIRIWSAACSTGQEPYSIGITSEEFFYAKTFASDYRWSVTATDISHKSIAIAKQGLYDDKALSRGMSIDRRNRFFSKQEDLWLMNSKIKDRVSFRPLNLLHNYAVVGRFEVVFCRNVLIYFSAELKKYILNRLAASLAPGGYLFLGSSETIVGYCDSLEMHRSENGVYYRLKEKPKYQTF